MSQYNGSTSYLAYIKNFFIVLLYLLLYFFARITKSLGCFKYTIPAISTGQASEKHEAHLDTEHLPHSTVILLMASLYKTFVRRFLSLQLVFDMLELLVV